MTSKIKVDNINKVSDDSNIIKKCGTTTTIGSGASNPIVVDGSAVTLGRCGGTVALASGATQTGFGRTGTVDWQTGSIKTSTFTAANGEGYFANTSGGAFVMNLPAGTAGNIVSVVDYTNTFQTNNLTVTPNGSQKIGGTNASATLSTEGQSVTFVYVDDTEGWKNVQDSTSNAIGNAFIVATGGTITTSGNDKIHTFTGPGTFTVSATASCAAENIVSYMVIAGGGGGGTSGAAGAGAGGYRELKSPSTPYTASPLDGYPSAPNRVTITATAFPITVGGGGATNPGPGSQGAIGVNGANSVFSTITSAGGGYGGARAPSIGPVTNGGPGGSGGGGSWDIPGTGSYSTGGTGNTPPTTPAQGNNGSRGQHNGPTHSVPGGGGGAGGAAPTSGPGGGGPAGYGTANGGDGTTSSINGTPTTRAGGGGGESGYGGAGGPGGGGAGAPPTTPAAGRAGTANTGGGGGGGPSCGTNPSAGIGGSGIVIIRYKFQ